LGSVWTQLGALKEAEQGRVPVLTTDAHGAWLVPYAEPGSPGRRLSACLDDYVRRFRENGGALAQSAVAALLAAGIALVIATFVGPSSLLVTGVALVVAVLVSLIAGDAVAQSEWAAGVRVGAAWLLGRSALGSWERWDWLPAVVLGLWSYGVARGHRADARAGMWLTRLACGGAIAMLVAQRQPLVAVAVALAGIVGERGLPERRSRVGLPWLLSALLLALAARYWI